MGMVQNDVGDWYYEQDYAPAPWMSQNNVGDWSYNGSGGIQQNDVGTVTGYESWASPTIREANPIGNTASLGDSSANRYDAFIANLRAAGGTDADIAEMKAALGNSHDWIGSMGEIPDFFSSFPSMSPAQKTAFYAQLAEERRKANEESDNSFWSDNLKGTLMVAGGALGLNALAGAGYLGGSTAAAGASAGAGAGASAVAGVEGIASQVALTAYEGAIAAGATIEVAAMAADVAMGLVGSGMSVADIVASAVDTATSTMATGAVDAAGNVIGGGGELTIGAGGVGTTGGTFTDVINPSGDGDFPGTNDWEFPTDQTPPVNPTTGLPPVPPGAPPPSGDGTDIPMDPNSEIPFPGDSPTDGTPLPPGFDISDPSTWGNFDFKDLSQWVPALIGAVMGGTQGQPEDKVQTSEPWNAGQLTQVGDAAINRMNDPNATLNLPDIPELPVMDDDFISQAIAAATDPMREGFERRTLPMIRGEFGDSFGGTRHEIAVGNAANDLQKNIGNTGARISSSLYPSVHASKVDAAKFGFEAETGQADANFKSPWTNIINASNVTGNVAGGGRTTTTQMPITPWWQTAVGGAAATQGVWDRIFGKQNTPV